MGMYFNVPLLVSTSEPSIFPNQIRIPYSRHHFGAS